MPKASIADLSTPRMDGRPRAIVCRADAPTEVQEVFDSIVASVSVDHFAPVDTVLLEQYAQAVVLGRRAYAELAASGPVVDGKTSPWLVALEKAHRSAVALAARLRLCPQSRFDRLKAGRTGREGVGGLDAALAIARGAHV